MQVYLVGGAVRDELLGIPVKDRDWVVVGATPEQMLEQGYRRADSDFPVFIHPKSSEEYALARVEYKTGCGYKGFEVYVGPDVTLEQDLKRRDLTINAMARTESGEIIDPFHGREDLAQGKLRHVSPAFNEDPLRVLRVARFAARLHHWGFHVAHGTHKLMRQIAESGEIKALSAARIWSEMSRALAEKSPAVFFHVLHRCGALHDCFAELDSCYAKADATSHQDNGSDECSNTALQLLADIADKTADAAQRFALLLWGIRQCEGSSAETICERYNAPGEYRELSSTLPSFVSALEQTDLSEAQAIMRLLEEYSALRKPEKFKRLLDTAAMLPHRQEDKINRLREASAKIASVSAQPLIKQGLNGEALGQALRQQRIEAIQNN